MEQIARDITELVGKTPLLEASRFAQARGVSCRILAKLEYLNPAGSVKDRVALSMIQDAEEMGILGPGSVIIEPTSGNTGIGLAAIGTARGYRVILTMPDTMSKERRDLLKAYGAEIVLTPGKEGMAGAIEKAVKLAESTPKSFVPGQFVNPANPRAHYCTTGPELWEQTRGSLDIFVAGIGTGGASDRHRPLSPGQESFRDDCGCGTCRLSRVDQGHQRKPWTSGYGSGLCAGGAGHLPVQRSSGCHGRAGLPSGPGVCPPGGNSGGNFLRGSPLGGSGSGRPSGKPGKNHCGAAAGHRRSVPFHPSLWRVRSRRKPCGPMGNVIS